MKIRIFNTENKMITSNTSARYTIATGLVYLIIMLFEMIPVILFRIFGILIYFIEFISDFLLMVFGFQLNESKKSE